MIIYAYLLAVLVLSNTYKGLLKSTCILEPKYATSIRSLFDAQNLTLYFGIEPSFRFGKGENVSCREAQLTAPAAGSEDRKRPAELVNYTTEYYLFWKKTCRSRRRRATELDGRHSCVLFESVIGAVSCWKSGNPITSRHCTAYDNMRKRVNLFCMEDLEKIAATRLAEPRTVFVCPVPYFQEDWDTIRKVSKSTGVKFMHNRPHKEVLFREPFGYGFSDGFPPENVNIPLFRLKALVSSGILQIWNMWKRISFGKPSKSEGGIHTVTSLSLGNSDVYLIFFLYLIGMVASCGNFILEMTGKLWKCRP